MCDPVVGKSIVLPEVLHGFPLHIVFMQDQVLSVTLDGLITYFRKGLDYRPVRSSTVDTKVIIDKKKTMSQRCFISICIRYQ